MKKIYHVIIALLITTTAFSQSFPTDEETKKITYSETVEIDTVGKDKLFERSKKWMITKCDDQKPDVADAEKGELKDEISFIIQLTYDFKYKKDTKVTFTSTINQKDGKYRYIFDNFRVYDLKSGERSQEPLESYYAKLRHNSKPELVTQVDKEVKDIIDELKKIMAKGEVEKKDDW